MSMPDAQSASEHPAPAGHANRLRFLDGQRGIAALSVVVNHYIGLAYTAYLPYGASLNDLPIPHNGFLGVELFFLISGFVIFMTLERSKGFFYFMRRRWLRLFPALLVASIFTFTVSLFISRYMPNAPHRLLDFLPGFTFVHHAIYSVLLHVNVKSMDAVYWTLYVEFTFYVLSGLLFFRFGWKGALIGLFLIWGGFEIAMSVIPMLPKWPPLRLIEPLDWQGFQNFGWFICGALFYKSRSPGLERLFWLAIAMGLLQTFAQRFTVPDVYWTRPAMILCVLFFAAALHSRIIQRILEWRPLQFAGFISYPLYLVHNNAGVGMIGWLGTIVSPGYWTLLPLLVGGLMILLSWIIAVWIEPAGKRMCSRLLDLPGSLWSRKSAGSRAAAG